MSTAPIKLQDFVRETLLEIINGVAEAQSNDLPNNAEINPVFYHFLQGSSTSALGINEKRSPIFNVDFDVSITSSLVTEIQGKAGIEIHVVSLGTHGESRKDNTSVGRIHFHVPIALPGKLYQAVMPEMTFGAEEILNDELNP